MSIIIKYHTLLSGRTNMYESHRAAYESSGTCAAGLTNMVVKVVNQQQLQSTYEYIDSFIPFIYQLFPN